MAPRMMQILGVIGICAFVPGYLAHKGGVLAWHYTREYSYVVDFPQGTAGDPIEHAVYRNLSSHAARRPVCEGCAILRHVNVPFCGEFTSYRYTRYEFSPAPPHAESDCAACMDLLRTLSQFFSQRDGLGDTYLRDVTPHFILGESYRFTKEDHARAYFAAPRTPMQRFLREICYARRGLKYVKIMYRLLGVLCVLLVLILLSRGRSKAGHMSLLGGIPMFVLFIAQYRLFYVLRPWTVTLPWFLSWSFLLLVLARWPLPMRRVITRRVVYLCSAASIVWGQIWLFGIDSPLAVPALWASLTSIFICLFLAIWPDGPLARPVGSDSNEE